MAVPSFWQRAAAVGVTAALTFAACGQQAAPPAATPAPGAATQPPAEAPAGQRGQGDELVILYWQAPTILNPHQATGTKDNDASRLILEPLASWTPEGEPLANGLAAEIPTLANGGVSQDLTTVTWKLREGVKWSDGSPFTADDVAFTYTYQCNEATAASTFSSCDNVASVTAQDPTTVVVKYASPQGFYYQWGVGFAGGMLQKKQFESCVGAAAVTCPANLEPIGTGPYKLKEFRPGDVVLYDLNENFRDPDKPYFKTVQFKGGGDANGAARAVFQTGEADYSWNLQIEAALLKSMADQSQLAELITNYGSSTERIMINFANPDPALGDQRSEPGTTHPILSDKAVRRALAMATDREGHAEQLYGAGIAGVSTCSVLGGPEAVVPDMSDLDVCKFDLAKAEQELEQAGWVKGADGVRAKGGLRLELSYATTVNAVRQKTQDIMKANWEKIGFRISLRSVPADVFFTNTSPDGANHFFYDLEMFTNTSDIDPTSALVAWTSAEMTGSANNWNSSNYNRYGNPDYDAKFDQLKRETDPEKRNALAREMVQILTEEVVIIALVNRTAATSGVSTKLKGVDLSAWDSEMATIQDWHEE